MEKVYKCNFIFETRRCILLPSLFMSQSRSGGGNASYPRVMFCCPILSHIYLDKFMDEFYYIHQVKVHFVNVCICIGVKELCPCWL